VRTDYAAEDFPLCLPWGGCGPFIGAMQDAAHLAGIELTILSKTADWSVFATHYQVRIRGPAVNRNQFKRWLIAAIAAANDAMEHGRNTVHQGGADNGRPIR